MGNRRDCVKTAIKWQYWSPRRHKHIVAYILESLEGSKYMKPRKLFLTYRAKTHNPLNPHHSNPYLEVRNQLPIKPSQRNLDLSSFYNYISAAMRR
jgi:hypothetical protein